MPAHDARSRRRRAASAAPPEDAAPFPSDAATPSAHDADERAGGGKRKAKADAKSPAKTGGKGGGKAARAALAARLSALEATAAALADRLDALTLVVETAVHASIDARPKAGAVARRTHAPGPDAGGADAVAGD